MDIGTIRILALGATVVLSGCLGGGGSSQEPAAAPAPVAAPAPTPAPTPPPVTPAPTPNSAPTISGTPTTSLRAGESYEFVPQASDPDGDALAFRIENQPGWASFDPATGRLAGTPAEADIGAHVAIRIAVSDGTATAMLGTFEITINQIALGSAVISWMPPTQNADGSALTDLAGYRIYYGRTRDQLDQTVPISSPGITTHVVDNLSPAVWYFAMTSLNSRGVESERSGTASKTIG